jgi:hypothetical protein
MRKGMLDFCKMIVERVSFSDVLFEKEVKKAFKQLSRDEIREFKAWLREKFREKTRYEYLFQEDPIMPRRYAM